jgi:hypothetical protein
VRKNRVFKPFGLLNRPLRQEFIDVTTTARAAGYNLRLRVETAIVRHYFLPASPDDDGVALIGVVVEALYLAIEEKMPAVRASYGLWLSLRFDLVAQHRRKNFAEILHLQILIGPCTADQVSVFVLRSGRPVPIEEPPF